MGYGFCALLVGGEVGNRVFVTRCPLSSRGTVLPEVGVPGLLPWLLGELCWAWLNLPHTSHGASPTPHHLGWKYLLLGSGSSLLIAQFTVLTYTSSQSSLSVLGFIILFLPKAFSLQHAMLNPGCLLHLTIRMATIMFKSVSPTWGIVASAHALTRGFDRSHGWHLSFSIMFLRIIHGVACISTSFLFL